MLYVWGVTGFFALQNRILGLAVGRMELPDRQIVPDEGNVSWRTKCSRNDAEQAVHNPVQNTAVPPRTESRESRNEVDVTPRNCNVIRHKSNSVRDYAKSTSMGRAGFEPAKALANGFTAHPL